MTREIKEIATNLVDGKLLRSLPIIAGLLAVFMLISYVLTFSALPLSESPGAWGEFGDYIGGVLNPVISLFTLMVAISLWSLQKKELKATQNALVKQASLQTFFSLLAQHRELVNSVQLNADKHEWLPNGVGLFKPLYEGRSAFSAVVSALTPRDLGDIEERIIAELSNDFEFTTASEDSFKSQLLFACWYEGNPCGLLGLEKQYFPTALEMSFGHIFRSIFQILKFAYQADGLCASERHDLVNYLRAQMSEDEFVLFALSSLTKIGQKSRGISIAFNFFENRMNTIEWAKPMQRLLSSSKENLEFSKSMNFSLVE